MKYIHEHNDLNYSQFNILLDSNKEKHGFIALALSGWHLSVIYSFLVKKENYSSGVVILYKKRVTREMIVEINNMDITYIFMEEISYGSKIKSWLHIFFSRNYKKNKNLYVLTPFGYNFSFLSFVKNTYRKRNFKLVKFDEGIGSYLNETKFNIAGSLVAKLRPLVYIKIVTKLLIKNVIVTTLKLTKHNLEEFMLFERTIQGSLIENESTVKFFKKFYLEFANYDLNLKTDQILVFKDFDLDRVEKEELLIFYRNLFLILSSYDKTIFLKKHPLDYDFDFDKIINENKNVVVLDSGLDAEMIYYSLKPKITIGGVSTCSFSIPVIFDDIVYNFSTLYLNLKISPELKNEVFLRIKYFQSIEKIKFLESFDVLKKLY